METTPMSKAQASFIRGIFAGINFSRPARRTILPAFVGFAFALGCASSMRAQLPPMPPDKVVEILGQRIHYHEAGTGQTIILLHGLGAASDIWAANIPALSTRYHVVVPDQIGFGLSDKPPIEYKIQTWVEFLAMFMDALRIPKATLVGNSLGGWIAVDFACQHPDKVDHLIIADAAGWRPINMPPPLADTLNDASVAGIREALERMLFERQAIPVDLNPGSIEGTRKMLEFLFSNKQLVTDQAVAQEFERHLKIKDGYTIERFLAGSLEEDQFENEKVKNLAVPTLILWGHDDHLFPIEQAQSYQQAIRGSKLVLIDHCGHMPQLEQSAEFNKAVLDYLAGAGASN
jgi:pimeloyl-ACP methyl ester carboxylesterase